MQNPTTPALAVLVVEVVIAGAFALAASRISSIVRRWQVALRIGISTLFAVPYSVVSLLQHSFSWRWCLLYALLPPAIVWLLENAASEDPEQRGNWRDAVILLILGLAVDLRWFDAAWPKGWEALGKILLVDVGLYGFLGIRQLSGTGFDLRLRWTDWKTGLRELLFFAPVVIAVGLALGFLHLHSNIPPVGTAVLRWIQIFFFVALPEELYFRAWVQNLLERRMGRTAALLVASVLFGLSHFNKRSASFNWRYVVLASIAGVFYGRAWRERHRVPASCITHTWVDWLWLWWF